MKTLLILLAILPILSAQPGRYGLPNCTAPDQQLAEHTHYLLCHSSASRIALWAAHELKSGQLATAAKRPSYFRPDTLLTGPTASNEDYRGSSYHRGHLVPAADFAASEPALRETFFLSNAVPQNPAVNTGIWRQLENAIRTLAAENDVLHVFTGVLFESSETERIGPSQVAVPSHIYKVVLAVHGDTLRMFAAIVPNSRAPRTPLGRFFTTVDEVESRTGLDFFAGLENEVEERLESTSLTAH